MIGPGAGAADRAEDDLKRTLTAVRKVTQRPIQTERSEHFQAVGDASDSFMKMTLGDCELITQDYFDHFQAKGFDIHNPDRRLTLVVFVNVRPFRSFGNGVPGGPTGSTNARKTGWSLFDFRNAAVRLQRSAVPSQHVNSGSRSDPPFGL